MNFVTSRQVRLIVGAVLLYAVAVVTSQCSPAHQAAERREVAATTLIGDPNVKPVVSVKELMKYMIDPLSDNIFDAVATDMRKNETIETFPRTEDDWDKIKIGAVTLAEGIELLKVRRPFAPKGDLNNSAGANPPELSPAQIQTKVDNDPVLWDAKIQQLRNVALEVLEIVEKKDVKALADANEDLDRACESCHLEYWYPGDPKILEEADKRLRSRKNWPTR